MDREIKSTGARIAIASLVRPKIRWTSPRTLPHYCHLYLLYFHDKVWDVFVQNALFSCFFYWRNIKSTTRIVVCESSSALFRTRKRPYPFIRVTFQTLYIREWDFFHVKSVCHFLKWDSLVFASTVFIVSKANHRSCKPESKLRALKGQPLFGTCGCTS